MRQNWPDPATADLAACNRLLRAGSKSFYAASLLLPRRDPRPGDGALRLLPPCRRRHRRWAGRSRRPSRGCGAASRTPMPAARTTIPADRAFSAVVRRFALPAGGAARADRGLCLGCARAAATRASTSSATMPPASPAAVGVMMATVMERRAPEVLARAADLGVAMQLTNIARDIGEDARRGRLYLPLDWLREEGIAPEALLADPVPSAGAGAAGRAPAGRGRAALSARRRRHRPRCRPAAAPAFAPPG